jgi:hypothetical protein
MPSVEELFCSVDDFCQVFEQRWQSQLLSHDLQVRKCKRSLCLSEVMTILIGFHQSYSILNTPAIALTLTALSTFSVG